MNDEVKRRLIHVSSAGLPGLHLLGLLDWTELRYLLVFGSVAVCVLEAVRLFVGIEWWVFDRLTREYERTNLAAYALGFFSLTAVALVFRPGVAIPGMLMLSIADPISGLLGSGELQGMKEVSVLGVTFGICLAIALAFVAAVPAVLGALAATLADGVKPVVRGYVIDDNLTIPIAAAAAIQLGLVYLPEIRV